MFSAYRPRSDAIAIGLGVPSENSIRLDSSGFWPSLGPLKPGAESFRWALGTGDHAHVVRSSGTRDGAADRGLFHFVRG